jgi:hypothetical protein
MPWQKEWAKVMLQLLQRMYTTVPEHAQQGRSRHRQLPSNPLMLSYRRRF